MLFEQTLANHDFKYNFKEYTKDVTELSYSEDGNRIYYPNVEQKNFEKIPGSPIGYWVSKTILDSYVLGYSMDVVAQPKQGSTLGDNNRFLRFGVAGVLDNCRRCTKVCTKHTTAKMKQRLNALILNDFFTQSFKCAEEHP